MVNRKKYIFRLQLLTPETVPRSLGPLHRTLSASAHINFFLLFDPVSKASCCTHKPRIVKACVMDRPNSPDSWLKPMMAPSPSDVASRTASRAPVVARRSSFLFE